MRTPTEKQYEKLLILGSGSVLLTASERTWRAMRKHGWTEDAWWPIDPKKREQPRAIPPQRITPLGLRALAAAMEKFGPPEMRRKKS